MLFDCMLNLLNTYLLLKTASGSTQGSGFLSASCLWSCLSHFDLVYFAFLNRPFVALLFGREGTCELKMSQCLNFKF